MKNTGDGSAFLGLGGWRGQEANKSANMYTVTKCG